MQLGRRAEANINVNEHHLQMPPFRSNVQQRNLKCEEIRLELDAKRRLAANMSGACACGTQQASLHRQDVWGTP